MAGSVHGKDLMFSLERIGKDLSKMLDNRTTLRAFIISSPRHRRAGERHLPPDGIGNLSIPETAPVGRGHVPAECRNYQVRTNLFMPAVCRFAVGGDMSPPYRGCFVYRGAFFACGLRGAQRRGNLMQERPTAYKPARRLAKNGSVWI